MLPVRLTLRHFLSYQYANIPFQGLHTVCICGQNGAGKSSLLEAITWSIWGQSRVTNEDDIIYGSEQEAQVDLIFQSHQQIYRIIRSHQRKQPTVLEFQVSTLEQGNYSGSIQNYQFRSLTEKRTRTTQQKIVETLKLDYETFVNSAYLRQGRADEFMLKRPSERKQVLADLLNLSHYDHLAEKAREQSRQFKAQVQVLSHHLKQMAADLVEQSDLEEVEETLSIELDTLQNQYDQNTLQLRQYQQQQVQQHQQVQHLNFLKRQHQRSLLEQQHQLTQLEEHQANLRSLEDSLVHQQEIETHYQQWQSLKTEEEVLLKKVMLYQELQTKLIQAQTEFDQKLQHLDRESQRYQIQWDQYQNQLADLQVSLDKEATLLEPLHTLQEARTTLETLDQLQSKVIPLRQRKQEIESELERLKTQVQTRLAELRPILAQIEQQQNQEPTLTRSFEEVQQKIEELEQRSLYHEQLREKLQERKIFLERLQAHQRDYEAQLEELSQKYDPLALTDPCPLCQHPLEETNWEHVQQHYAQQCQEILDMLRVLQDQVKVSKREIEVLQQEYWQVDQDLKTYPALIEYRGKIQQQLLFCQTNEGRYQALKTEVETLENRYQRAEWHPMLQAELLSLETTLSELGYDDRSHALVRGEVERWRWAEIRYAEVQSSKKQFQKIQDNLPELEEKIANLQIDKEALYSHENSINIQVYQKEMVALEDDLTRYAQVQKASEALQPWVERYQTLQQAKSHYQQALEQLKMNQEQVDQTSQKLESICQEIQALDTQVQAIPPLEVLKSQISQCHQTLQQLRQTLDQKLGEKGRLEQKKHHLHTLRTQHQSQTQTLEQTQYQYRIYHELAQAFSKNGIQALIIENFLPQLEAETNRLLSRLTNYQFNVQFITQRSSRQNSTADKLIDTLDIRIADARGTRPYETYSGGEAFRVNFAIRLALARILSQRSGSPLQLLIVDEGFGTQDAEGCDRLIASINTIANDFSCILMITHMPQFKEAFQTRIEIEKTAAGSQLNFVW